MWKEQHCQGFLLEQLTPEPAVLRAGETPRAWEFFEGVCQWLCAGPGVLEV